MDNIGIAEVFEFIDDGNFKKAGVICLELLKQEPENAAVYVAMLMIEMQAKNANQIKANLHMYTDSDNYKNAVRYDDGRFAELLKINKRKAKKVAGRKRKKGIAIVLLILFIAALAVAYVYLMPAVKYHKANEYLQNGDYSQASEVFDTLGEYKDSEEKFETAVLECAGILYESGDITGCLTELERVGKGNSENVSKLRYRCAMSAMNGMSYIEAASAFELLGDYQDSEQKLHNCYLYYACYLSDSGDKEGAVKILKHIGLDEEDIFDMKYDHGSFLFDHQMYYDAKLHYALLGDYRDCIMKIVYIDSIAGETEYTVTDNPGDELSAAGVFTSYSEAFESLLQNEGCHIYDDKGVMYY